VHAPFDKPQLSHGLVTPAEWLQPPDHAGVVRLYLPGIFAVVAPLVITAAPAISNGAAWPSTTVIDLIAAAAAAAVVVAADLSSLHLLGSAVMLLQLQRRGVCVGTPTCSQVYK